MMRWLVLSLTMAVAVVGHGWSGGNPLAAAAPKVYVGLFRDNAVAVVDTASRRVIGTIPVPRGPHGLVVTPDGGKVYVSSDGDSTVSVIETATDRVIGTIPVGPNPHGLAMAPDGRHVLVSAWGANRALLIDTASDRVVGEMPVAQAHNGTISSDGRTAWVGSQQQGATALVKLDLATRTEVARVVLDRTPRALDLSPDGRWLYFTVAGASAVMVLDTATNRITSQIPVGASPHQAPFTPDGRWALVPSQGPGELGVLEVATGSLATTVPVGKTPHWVTVSSDGRTAFVTNEGSNDLSVVDLVGRRVVATIPVGNAPRKVAVQPGPVGPAPTSAPVPGGPGATATAGPVRYADHGTEDLRDRGAQAVVADDYYFAPTFLRGQPRQRVRLTVENRSSALHNVSVPELGIDRDVPPGGRVGLDVAFPESGATRFYCKFHSALGQNGQLLAVDPKRG